MLCQVKFNKKLKIYNNLPFGSSFSFSDEIKNKQGRSHQAQNDEHIYVGVARVWVNIIQKHHCNISFRFFIFLYNYIRFNENNQLI
jgi:hypothetical protein